MTGIELTSIVNLTEHARRRAQGTSVRTFLLTSTGMTREGTHTHTLQTAFHAILDFGEALMSHVHLGARIPRGGPGCYSGNWLSTA
eukprot:scaffold27848_cov36-Tisochrysis_lutea.AAC.1